MLGAVNNRQNEDNENVVRAPMLRGLRANNRKTSGSIRVRNQCRNFNAAMINNTCYSSIDVLTLHGTYSDILIKA